MASVTASPSARQDAADIADYLATEAGKRIAVKYLGLFSAAYDKLAAYPESGPRRPRLGLSTRIDVVSPYLIIYDYDPRENTVLILRILHGARRITRKLLK